MLFALRRLFLLGCICCATSLSSYTVATSSSVQQATGQWVEPKGPAIPATGQSFGGSANTGGAVEVAVTCYALHTGILKDCVAVGSKPKNPVAETLASDLANRMRRNPAPSQDTVVTFNLMISPPHMVK